MRVIVAHPVQQHSFKLATALKKHGMLDKYFTTVYLKKRNLTALVTTFLNKKYRDRAQGRYCEYLDDKDVMQYYELTGLIRLFFQNISFFNKFYPKIRYPLADRFAKKVAKYAIKHNIDVVVTYDDCSPLLFEIIKKKAPHIKCVLDTSAANRLYMKQIYEKDTELAPVFADRLMNECVQCWDEKILDRVEREIRSADMFLVPSEFVEESLLYSGIQPEQILKCRYGVDTSMFSPKEASSMDTNKALNFIYVGGVKELKGIYYLLEAFRQIPKEKATLTILGNANLSDDDMQTYKDVADFTGFVLHSNVADYLKKADVFVFPSLGDSFALSAMEAAACGLPLIVSENTGMSDCMSGKEGFVIPIQSIEAIVEKVNWFIENRDSIAPMGQAARKMAEDCKWENYYEKIGEIFSSQIIRGE